MTMAWTSLLTCLSLLSSACVLAQEDGITSEVSTQNNETMPANESITTPSFEHATEHVTLENTVSINTTIPGKQIATKQDNSKISTESPGQSITTSGNIPTKESSTSTTVSPNEAVVPPEEPNEDDIEAHTGSNERPQNPVNSTETEDLQNTMTTSPVTISNLDWMHTFLNTHHFEGQYSYDNVQYLFSFVVRHKHQLDYKTLVTTLYDQDGAVLEFNGTSVDGHIIVFTLAHIYTPGTRFPLKNPLQITGSFQKEGGTYFAGNFTQPINSSFSWFRMNKGLGTIETGETEGTRTAIIIIIPTSIAFLGICGTVAIVCWASKKGYLRGRHKSYRLFTDAQVSYESEAETIHI